MIIDFRIKWRTRTVSPWKWRWLHQEGRKRWSEDITWKVENRLPIIINIYGSCSYGRNVALRSFRWNRVTHVQGCTKHVLSVFGDNPAICFSIRSFHCRDIFIIWTRFKCRLSRRVRCAEEGRKRMLTRTKHPIPQSPQDYSCTFSKPRISVLNIEHFLHQILR